MQRQLYQAGSSNFTVSGDATWKTRGHSSRFGATSIIDEETGIMLQTVMFQVLIAHYVERQSIAFLMKSV